MRSKRAVPTVVIDTNVLYAADDLNDSLCQKASLEQIESVKMGKERIALDKQGYILEEYTRFAKTLDNTSVRKQFVNWLRAYSHTKCLQVDPQPTDNSGVNFSWFPATLRSPISTKMTGSSLRPRSPHKNKRGNLYR
jgi:hypothetical protein